MPCCLRLLMRILPVKFTAHIFSALSFHFREPAWKWRVGRLHGALIREPSSPPKPYSCLPSLVLTILTSSPDAVGHLAGLPFRPESLSPSEELQVGEATGGSPRPLGPPGRRCPAARAEGRALTVRLFLCSSSRRRRRSSSRRRRPRRRRRSSPPGPGSPRGSPPWPRPPRPRTRTGRRPGRERKFPWKPWASSRVSSKT